MYIYVKGGTGESKEKCILLYSIRGEITTLISDNNLTNYIYFIAYTQHTLNELTKLFFKNIIYFHAFQSFQQVTFTQSSLINSIPSVVNVLINY